MLDEHYNHVKALDALNQELFQLQMGGKEMVSEWGVHLLRHLQILMALVSECILPDHIAKLNHGCFYGGLPKHFKVMLAYLKASSNEKMYSDYLSVAQEAEKEEAMEPCCNPPTANTSQPQWWASFLCRSSKAVSQLWPPLHRWCTWRKRAIAKTQMALKV